VGFTQNLETHPTVQHHFHHEHDTSFGVFFPLLHHFSGQKIRDHPVPTILIQIFFGGMNIQHFWCDNRTAWLDPRELGVSGFLGGMGGNAMIGLSTINVLNGGRGRMAPTL